MLNMTGTSVVMVVVAIILLVWECVAFAFGERRALISTWMQKAGFRSPAIALVVGMFLGHFWLYFPPTLDDEKVVCPHCRSSLILRVDESGTLSADVE